VPAFRDEHFQSIVVGRSAFLESPALSRTRVIGEIFYGPHYSIIDRLGQAGYGFAGHPFADDLIAHRAA
jgi:hypothetical protein